MKKITKAQVRAMVKALGTVDIELYPSKCGPSNQVWVQGYSAKLYNVGGNSMYMNCDFEYAHFDVLVNYFTNYNCSAELGQNVHYYVKQEDFDSYYYYSKPKYA